MICGTCHCGNVRFEVAELPDWVVSCNCSICHRLGALWAYYAPGDVVVTVATGATSTYCWGDGMIAFHHCPGCGCTTHFTSTAKSDRDGMAINCRMVDRQLIEPLPVRRFDGANSWRFLEDSGKEPDEHA